MQMVTMKKLVYSFPGAACLMQRYGILLTMGHACCNFSKNGSVCQFMVTAFLFIST